MKISAEVETFRPATLAGYATLCGWALARAHAKAGDAATIAGYLGSSDQFDDALAQYSEAYADQAERDFKVFHSAIRSGRLSTEPEKDVGLEFLLLRHLVISRKSQGYSRCETIFSRRASSCAEFRSTLSVSGAIAEGTRSKAERLEASH
jgi:NAD(P)H-dependent flavin oxidoreductase YrpB (nitropropane dioxygenase family)